MSHVSRDLLLEFAGDADVLRKLKTESPHFLRLNQSYDELAAQIQHIEAGADAASDSRLETLKKQRLALLDEIAVMVGKARETLRPQADAAA